MDNENTTATLDPPQFGETATAAEPIEGYARGGVEIEPPLGERGPDDEPDVQPLPARTRITLTRIRKINAAAKALDKAHRTFLAETGELLAGRDDENGNVVDALRNARGDFLTGAFAEGAAGIALLTEEFESLHS